MYLVYESLYGELLNECDSTNIIGLYGTRELALEKAKYLINEDIRCNNYILDKENNDIEENNCVRLFYDHQENWNDYYEIFIQEIQVQYEEKWEK